MGFICNFDTDSFLLAQAASARSVVQQLKMIFCIHWFSSVTSVIGLSISFDGFAFADAIDDSKLEDFESSLRRR